MYIIVLSGFWIDKNAHNIGIAPAAQMVQFVQAWRDLVPRRGLHPEIATAMRPGAKVYCSAMIFAANLMYIGNYSENFKAVVSSNSVARKLPA